MDYSYIKALHIIFVVTWFAGLFYFPRLLIYHAEAIEKDLEGKDILIAQFKIMQKRLWYGITWPSAILTIIFGGSLLKFFMPISDHKWLLTKLGFVVGLFVYHVICGFLRSQMDQGIIPLSSTKLRIWNEVSTIFLIAIVFLVVAKDLLSMVYGVIGLIVVTICLMIAIKVYKNIRERS